MYTYKVKIYEVNSEEFKIEAKNIEDAKKKAIKEYVKGSFQIKSPCLEKKAIELMNIDKDEDGEPLEQTDIEEF